MSNKTTISIRAYNCSEPIKFTSDNYRYAEDIIFELLTNDASFGFNPISINLFALYNVKHNVYLAPNYEWKDVFTKFGKSPEFILRIRFLPYDAKLLLKCDPKAFSYYFKQVQHDFKYLRNCDKYENQIYGLSIFSVIIEALENKFELEKDINLYVDKVFKHLPEQTSVSFIEIVPLMKNSSRREKIKEKLLETYHSMKNVDMFKVYFINQFVSDLDCSDEHYKVELTKFRGVESFTKKLSYSCSTGQIIVQSVVDDQNFEELFHIKMLMEVTISNDNNSVVYVSRIDSAPVYLKFEDPLKSQSFVSLLSGYYRLRHKWNTKICSTVFSPWLKILKQWFSHGPVSRDFVREKLENFNESQDSDDFFIIYQSERKFRRFYVECMNERYSLTYESSPNKEPSFLFADDDRHFNQPAELSEFFRSKLNASLLASKDNDYPTTLMLCRNPQEMPQYKIEPKLKVVHQEQLEKTKFFLQRGYNFTTHYGSLRLTEEKNRRIPVMIKEFNMKMNSTENHSLMSKWIKLSDMSLVNCIGVLIYPFTMISEKCQTSLEELFHHRETLKTHHLAQAGYYLARALDYLYNANFVHGQIRFENIFVSHFSPNMLRIKLGDPVGMMNIYNDQASRVLQRPWLPPEYYDSNDSLSGKLTSFCDVYSYGTTLYQIYNSGQLPNFDMINSCDTPPKIMKVVTACWENDYKRRIQPNVIFTTLTRIVNSFDDIKNQYEEFQQKYFNNKLMAASTSAGMLNRSSTLRKDAKLSGNYSETFDDRRSMSGKRSYSFLRSIFKQRRASSMASIRSSSTDTTMVFNQSDSASIYEHIKDDEGFSFSNIKTEAIRLEKKIGEGQYGRVFVATHIDQGIEKQVAIKFITQKDAMNLKAEIDILSKLNHKNIVRILGCTQVSEFEMGKFKHVLKDFSGNGMVVEYFPRGSLDQYLKIRSEEILRGSKYKVPFIKFAKDIAEGLLYLKNNNIVHRDLAARNILVSRENEVKISDFGLSLILQKEEDYSNLKAGYFPFRTWPPETMVLNFSRFTHQSDIWSYGILLSEMFDFCQHDPFPEFDNEQLPNALYNHLRNEKNRPKRKLDCPVEVYDIMQRCWKWNPEDRPSISTICDELEIILPNYS